MAASHLKVTEIVLPLKSAQLRGDLVCPPRSLGLVIFAHGSGSSRKSSRNVKVASFLQSKGLATLLFDLLTPMEEVEDVHSGQYRFNISLLASRLSEVSIYMRGYLPTSSLNQGFFGASTGAAAALVSSVQPGVEPRAIVSRGGRPDLAAAALPFVSAAVLLIVGGQDQVVLQLNREAYNKLECEKELSVIAGATHLFEEPGALEEVAELAAEWFLHKLPS